MKKNPKNKKDGHNFFKGKIFFAILGLIIMAGLSTVAIWNIVFLGKELRNAYNVNLNKNSSLKFNTEDFQGLKIIR